MAVTSASVLLVSGGRVCCSQIPLTNARSDREDLPRDLGSGCCAIVVGDQVEAPVRHHVVAKKGCGLVVGDPGLFQGCRESVSDVVDAGEPGDACLPTHRREL